MKMTSVTNQGTILRNYTLMLLPELTPKRIPIKWLWQDYKDWSYQSFFFKVQLNFVFKLPAINGLPGLSWSVRRLYLALIQLQIVIAAIINRFVWSTLTKSSTLTCAKTKAENLSSSHVTTRPCDDGDTAEQTGTTSLCRVSVSFRCIGECRPAMWRTYLASEYFVNGASCLCIFWREQHFFPACPSSKWTPLG